MTQKLDFAAAAKCLKTIAHPQRLSLIYYLIKNKKASVGELAEYCSLPSHMVSEHLTLMKDRGFLTSQKEGRKTFYAIEETGLKGIIDCIECKFIKKTKPKKKHA